MKPSWLAMLLAAAIGCSDAATEKRQDGVKLSDSGADAASDAPAICPPRASAAKDLPTGACQNGGQECTFVVSEPCPMGSAPRVEWKCLCQGGLWACQGRHLDKIICRFPPDGAVTQ
jgi:hypothetical protein